MKTYRVRLQPAALEDLDEAYRFSAKNAPETAFKWFNRFFDSLQTLARRPGRCMTAAEDRKSKRELRQLL